MSIGGGVESRGKTKGRFIDDNNGEGVILSGKMSTKKTGGKTPEMILPIGKARARLKVQTGG